MSRITVVGEAFGEHEDRERVPFCGPAGYELTKMLTEAGLHRSDCYLTNVFNLRPKNNDLSSICGPKTSALPGYPPLLTRKATHRFWTGGYIRAEFAPELTRLASELLAEDPNIVIALGNTAMWALLGKTAITKFRGTTAVSSHTAAGFKVLPTYHPAAILRQWELRPIAVIDLSKARREAAFPEVRRPEVTIYVPETIVELQSLARDVIGPARTLAIDIETSGNQITCIGFAPSCSEAVVVPIVDHRQKSKSYWPTASDERAAWEIIRRICGTPLPPKVFQNGLYDIAFLWRAYGIKVLGAEHDTMLLHHALQPESLKGLGFLGSVYSDWPAWKELRHSETIKRDE